MTNKFKHGLKRILILSLSCILLVCLLVACKEKDESLNVTSSEDVQAPYGVRIASITDDGIEVYWKRPEFSDGYEIYRSYSKEGGYTLLEDLKKYNSWSYFDTSFDKSKSAVYYKVCNYVLDEKGNKKYSNFCDTMKAGKRSKLVINRKGTIYLASDYTFQMEAYFGWGNLHDVKWTSTDESVAVIDENGLLKGVSKGTCTLKAKSKQAKNTATVKVEIDRDATTMLDTYKSRYKETSEDMWENPDAEETNDAVIMMLGDLMCMKPQQQKQGGKTGDYNFNESYDFVKDVFATSDYTIGNLETMVDSAYPYYIDKSTVYGKPNCNAPARILDALKYAGIDGLYTSNNHNCDADIHGIKETIKQCERYEFGNTGILDSKDDNRTLIVDINGIKVGFLSYGTGYNGHSSNWDPEDVDTYLNQYDKDKAANDVQLIKSQGAEYVIVFMHWGVKNNINYNEEQENMAQELADMGADYIVGSHPHVLQAYEEITSTDGRTVPCIYSLGDFNSSLIQIPGNRETIILRIRLTKDESGKITLAENNYIPAHIYNEYEGKLYATVPLNYDIMGDAELPDYDTYINRIQDILGDKITEYQWK